MFLEPVTLIYALDAIKCLVVMYCHLKVCAIFDLSAICMYSTYIIDHYFWFYDVGLKIAVFKHAVRHDTTLEMCFLSLVLYQLVLLDSCFIQFSMIYVCT